MTIPATPQRKSLTGATTVTWPQIRIQIQTNLNLQYRSQILSSLSILLSMACSHLPHRYPLPLVSSPIRRQLTSSASSTTLIGSSTRPLSLRITTRNLPLIITNPLLPPNFPHYNLPPSRSRSHSNNTYPRDLLHPQRQISRLLATNRSFQVLRNVLIT